MNENVDYVGVIVNCPRLGDSVDLFFEIYNKICDDVRCSQYIPEEPGCELDGGNLCLYHGKYLDDLDDNEIVIEFDRSLLDCLGND
jgi:hypothetical protein